MSLTGFTPKQKLTIALGSGCAEECTRGEGSASCAAGMCMLSNQSYKFIPRHYQAFLVKEFVFERALGLN
jgi:hypothetical protein